MGQFENRKKDVTLDSLTMLQRLKNLLHLIGRPGRIKFASLLFLMTINAFLEMAGLGSIPLFILILSSPETVLKSPWAGPVLIWLDIVSPKSLMIWGCVGLVGLFTLKNIFFSVVIYIKTKVVYNQQVQMGDRLFRAYMGAPYTFFLSRNSAELLRNVHNETKLVISGVTMPLLQIALDGLVLVGIAVLLISVEPLISLLTFAALGTLGIGFARLT
ncbi:MAG: ABC transporter transmembrane domain-containing protein, partial [Smithellaceae bacterium]